MRLYSYSSELHTFVEAKWAKTTIAAGGILIGTILFFGVIGPNQSIGNFRESRSARALAAENDILRLHLSVISPRLGNVEVAVTQLDGRIKSLRALLYRRTIVRDTVWRLTNVAQGRKLQSAIHRMAGLHP